MALAACTGEAPSKPELAKLQSDIDIFCQTVADEYVYFESRADRWDKICDNAREAAGKIDLTRAPERLSIFETMMEGLADSHLHFATNSGQSPFTTPDYWVEGNRVTAVRPQMGPALAGLKVGDEVVEIDELPLRNAIERYIHPSGYLATAEQKRVALELAVTGYRGKARSVTVLRDGNSVHLPFTEVSEPESQFFVDAKLLDNDIAYIRMNDGLWADDTVGEFDAALETVKTASAWVLDLRNTDSGGNTGVAEPIMGRFLTVPVDYQKLIPRTGEAFLSRVEPVGPWTAMGPMVVLVGRWTGSMGEGMAVGFDAIGRADVIGTDMSRLAGAMNNFNLPENGFPYRLSVTDIQHMNGTPRHEWSPPYFVVADNGNGDDLALQYALKHLESRREGESRE